MCLMPTAQKFMLHKPDNLADRTTSYTLSDLNTSVTAFCVSHHLPSEHHVIAVDVISMSN